MGLGHVVGIFSEDGRVRLDLGSASCKPCAASHESWATRVFVRPVGQHSSANAPIAYGQLVGVFSETGGKRLDLGSKSRRSCKADHDSWATQLRILPVSEPAF